MWSNPQLPADLVTFTEEILDRKLHSLCSGKIRKDEYSKLYVTTQQTFVGPEDVFKTCLEDVFNTSSA